MNDNTAPEFPNMSNVIDQALTEYLKELFLFLPSFFLYLLIFVSLIIFSRKALKKKIPGGSYIFWGLLGSFLFSLITLVLLSVFEASLEENHYEILSSILDCISLVIFMFAVWGFKIMVQQYHQE